MWHEARKNEKIIEGMMVDYKKRAERRRNFYGKIRRDPVEFLQVHGSKMKINIDNHIAIMADRSLVPWRGDTSNMIDRFDGRAHLDVIPMASKRTTTDSELMTDRLNYERWKPLVMNEFMSISEDRALQIIELQERFDESKSDIYQEQKDLKKKLTQSKSTISYNYDTEGAENRISEVDESDSDCSEPEMEEVNNISIAKLSPEHIVNVNSIASKFGVKNDHFVKFMDEDRLETERIKAAKVIEREKSMFSGRKGRRERRNFNHQRSLVVRSDPPADVNGKKDGEASEENDSSSDSGTVINSMPEFITSYGGSSGDEKTESLSKDSFFEKSKVKFNVPIATALPSTHLESSRTKSDSHTRTFLPDNSYHRRSRSRSRDQDRSHPSRRPWRHENPRSHRKSSSPRRKYKSKHISDEETFMSRETGKSRNQEKMIRNISTQRRRRSKERDGRRGSNVDDFGREICLRDVALESAKQSAPEDITPVYQSIPPPPIKKYYRHELDHGSDSELEEFKAELKSNS